MNTQDTPTITPPAEPVKVRISATDFLRKWEQYPIGATDKNGKAICYGHTVSYNGEQLLVCYRYGNTILKQPFMLAGLSLNDYTAVEVTNQVTACEDWLIIGLSDEPFIKALPPIE